MTSDFFRSDSRVQPKPDVTAEVEEKSSWTPSYSVTQLPGATPMVGSKEEPPAPQDVPTADGPAVKEVESTSLSGPAIDDTTLEAKKGDGPHYFPEVPESLDEAPER